MSQLTSFSIGAHEVTLDGWIFRKDLLFRSDHAFPWITKTISRCIGENPGSRDELVNFTAALELAYEDYIQHRSDKRVALEENDRVIARCLEKRGRRARRLHRFDSAKCVRCGCSTEAITAFRWGCRRS